MAAAFNAWLESYIEHPDEFRTIEAEIADAIAEASDGRIPSYGERCVATLKRFASE